MGRTVAAVVGTVAIIALAIAAPYIVGPAFLGLTGMTASIATAAIMAVGSVAISMGMRMIAGGAPVQRSPTQAPYPQGTAIVGAFGPRPRHKLDHSMPPVREPWLIRWWNRRDRRFAIIQLMGDCMAPELTDAFAIVDATADIREGDLAWLGISDRQEALGGPPGQEGFVKRFVGVNRELGFVECECTNPPYTIHTGLTGLRWAFRVRATARTFKEARRLLKAVQRDPAAYDRPLMP